MARGATHAHLIGALDLQALRFPGGATMYTLINQLKTGSGINTAAIVATTIAANAITTAKIATNAVTTAKILNAKVTTAKLATNAVTAAKVNALAITAAKIATNAVTVAKVNALAITAAKIATNAVTAAKINALAVTAAKLATNAVTVAKVNALTITTAKIATNAVTAAKIAAGKVALGTGTDGATAGKLDAKYQVFTSGGAGATNTVAHGLGRVPTGFVVTKVNKASVIYDAGVSWTATNIYLKSEVATTAVTVLVY